MVYHSLSLVFYSQNTQGVSLDIAYFKSDYLGPNTMILSSSHRRYVYVKRYNYWTLSYYYVKLSLITRDTNDHSTDIAAINI